MPEWIIYKNDIKIGQAFNWYKALDMLVKQERLHRYLVCHLADGLVTVNKVIIGIDDSNHYKIQKER